MHLRSICLLGLMLLWPAATAHAGELTRPVGVACSAGEEAWLSTSLFFGRSISDGGAVSDAEWLGFVEAEIAPRFPAGFTVLDGNGFWRKADGTLGQEASKVLVVLHAPSPSQGPAFEAIIAAYKSQFRQKSVLKSVSAACIKF